MPSMSPEATATGEMISIVIKKRELPNKDSMKAITMIIGIENIIWNDSKVMITT